MNDRRAAESLEASLGNIQTLTERINAGEGSIGKLLKDDAFSRSLTSATANFDAVAAQHQERRGHHGEARDRSGAVRPTELDVRRGSTNWCCA